MINARLLISTASEYANYFDREQFKQPKNDRQFLAIYERNRGNPVPDKTRTAAKPELYFEPDRMNRLKNRWVLEAVRPPSGKIVMEMPPKIPTLTWDPHLFGTQFDREPFGFEHNLAGLELFKFDGLVALAEKYAALDQEYFVAGSAPSPGTAFYTVPSVGHRPHEALEQLDRTPCRVLLKRPENLDQQFRELLDQLWRQVAQSRAELRDQEIVRLESSIFISSAATTTPFHFDPEVNFFSQIEGDKIYHVYPPDVVGERELERFYKHGIVNIGQIDLSTRPADRERVFTLRAGDGLHQPQNAPHWVETGPSRSISYSFVFETAASRALGRTRTYNNYLRKLGLDPAPPGRRPMSDAAKAKAMQVTRPARRSLSRAVRALLGQKS